MVHIRQALDSDVGALPRDRYDIVTKDALERFPEAILHAVLERTDFRFVEFMPGELTQVEVRRTDSLMKVELGDAVVLVHIEFQVSDSTPIEMARRNVGYLGRCYEKYGLPMLSHVVYLRPTAGRRDPGGYRQEIPNYRFIVEYKVIRLIELEGASVFETQNAGLMPFAPLMRPPAGMTSLQWAIQCNQRTKTLSLPREVRSNLLVSQWVLSGLIHRHQAIGSFLSEAVMQESSVYQHLAEERYQQGIEQGIEQGARQMSIESTVAILNSRFPHIDTNALRSRLEALDDLDRLRQVNLQASIAKSFEAFQEDLDA